MNYRGLFSVYILLAIPALAQPEKALVFANGMGNEKPTADNYLEALIEAYKQERGLTNEQFDQEFETDVFYNATKGLAIDFVEVLGQDLGMLNGHNEGLKLLERGADPDDVGLGYFYDFYLDYSNSLSTLLARFKIEHWVQLGKKTVIACHSQGCYLANQVYSELTPAQQSLVGIVAIAPPTPDVAGDGEYITASCDLVVFGRPLSANVPSPDLFRTFDCHSFYTYVDGSRTNGVSRTRILDAIDSTFERLATPPNPSPVLPINGSFSAGPQDWTMSGDFWAGTNLGHYRTALGYAAGGVDGNGNHKNSASGSMSQFVSIPADYTSAKFSFWINVTSNETTLFPFDILTVDIFDSSGTILIDKRRAFSNLSETALRDYRNYTIDVSELVGQEVQIRFTAQTDANLTTVFRIDDVRLVLQ